MVKLTVKHSKQLILYAPQLNKQNKAYSYLEPILIYFSIAVWNDARTEETVQKVLERIPNNDPDYFKNIAGKSLQFASLNPESNQQIMKKKVLF